MKVKSFRGQLAHQGQDVIRLGTNQGLIGYKINKFQLIGPFPTGTSQESVMQIYSQDPNATPDGQINFENPLLLAAAYYETNNSSANIGDLAVIFDHVKFNQDIYITHFEGGGTAACNYYLELEQIKLDLNEATVATLKDMRGRE